jgi:hypothetical protein
MKPRHNNLERVGLHFIAQIFEEDFEWIFREQSVADVGIDAVVEHCKDGNPSGKLLALQIKSGEGNVKKTQTGYTYYISNTHYYYWINHQLPIVLTCYIKDKKKKVYWAEISKSTIKPTKTRWKIEIPKDQLLTSNSFKEIERIVNHGNKIILRASDKSRQPAEKEIFKICALNPMNLSLKFLVDFTSTLGENLRDMTSRAELLTSITDEEDKNVQLHKLKCELNYIMSGFATRTSAEIKTFGKLYSELLSGINSKHKILSEQSDESGEKEKDISSVTTLITSMDNAIVGIEALKNSLSSLRDLEMLIEKAEISLAILATDQVINEMKISKHLGNQLINSIRKDYK